MTSGRQRSELDHSACGTEAARRSGSRMVLSEASTVRSERSHSRSSGDAGGGHDVRFQAAASAEPAQLELRQTGPQLGHDGQGGVDVAARAPGCDEDPHAHWHLG